MCHLLIKNYFLTINTYKMKIYISKSQLASDEHVEKAKTLFNDNHPSICEYEHYDFKKHGKYDVSKMIDDKDAVIIVAPENNNPKAEQDEVISISVGFGNFQEAKYAKSKDKQVYFYNKEVNSLCKLIGGKAYDDNFKGKNPKYMYGKLYGKTSIIDE